MPNLSFKSVLFPSKWSPRKTICLLSLINQFQNSLSEISSQTIIIWMWFYFCLNIKMRAQKPPSNKRLSDVCHAQVKTNSYLPVWKGWGQEGDQYQNLGEPLKHPRVWPMPCSWRGHLPIPSLSPYLVNRAGIFTQSQEALYLCVLTTPCSHNIFGAHLS